VFSLQGVAIQPPTIVLEQYFQNVEIGGPEGMQSGF